MSQHISGDIGQSIRNDFGPFITIGPDMRIRKEHILAYYKTNSRPGDGAEIWGIAFSFNGTAFCFQAFPDEETVDLVMSYLDKQFEVNQPSNAMKVIK